MKKLAILSAIALSGFIFDTANAQIRIHLGFNFSPRPVVYEPAPVFEQEEVYQEQQPVYDDADDDYYYLPDVDSYYDVTQQCYFYNDGNNWISSAYLPGAYRDYDWRDARRFEVRTSRPYMHADFYRSRYNGHQFNGWAHGGFEHRDGYAFNGNRDFNHRDEHKFENRGQGGFDHRFENRGQGDFGQRFENRSQGGYNQPQQNRGDNHRFENSSQGGFNRPQQSRNDNHQFGNRSQVGYAQQQQNHDYVQPQQNRGSDQQFNGSHAYSAQPSNQRGGDQMNNNRGGNNHFIQNGPRGGVSASRVMTRF